MKKTLKTLIMAALISTASLAAHAQTTAENFTGASVGLNLGATRNKVSYEGLLNTSSTKTDLLSQLEVAYGFQLPGSWVLGLGATYDLNKAGFNSVSYVDSGHSYSVTSKLKNHYSLYMAPGYRLTPTLLVFGKLAWHSAKSEINDQQLGNLSSSHNGVGYGIGIATMLAKQLEGRFEIQQVNLSRENVNLTSGKPSLTQATVSVAYRF